MLRCQPAGTSQSLRPFAPLAPRMLISGGGGRSRSSAASCKPRRGTKEKKKGGSAWARRGEESHAKAGAAGEPLCAREAAEPGSPRAPQVLPRRRSGRGLSVLQPPPSPAHPRGTWHSGGGAGEGRKEGGGNLELLPCWPARRTQPGARKALPRFGGVASPPLRPAGKRGPDSARRVRRAPLRFPAGSVCGQR